MAMVCSTAVTVPAAGTAGSARRLLPACRRGGFAAATAAARATHRRVAIRAWRSVAAAAGQEGAATEQGSTAVPAADSAAAAPLGAGSAAQLQPTRLQQEEELLVAVDVEYTHLKLSPGGRHVSLPAEVCAVDAAGRVLLYEHCNPLEGDLAERRRWRHVGGAPPPLWLHAPPLREVRRQLAALLQGRVLVGHHLNKDLKALGLSHPPEATRDTLQYRELQGRRGSGRKLRDLSAEKLGRTIQAAGRRHSPREDAAAAMDLYLRYVHYGEQYMRYEDMVERHLAEILGGAAGGSMHSVDSEDGSSQEA